MYGYFQKLRIKTSHLTRLYHCLEPEVRVRFAPSPTGYLHLGGLRTALYNYLFAKSKNGKYILRIEDTDQSRKVEGAIESLVDDLTWAGIEFDEGPLQGGSYGPYIQSQRLDLYKEYAEKLLETGAAYRCFCTPTRLDLLRRDNIRLGLIPKYDNRCSHLPWDQSCDKAHQGVTFCIRLKLTSDNKFTDLVYGPINHDVSGSEGDPVIFKADGYPTYHLANVVDDHLMGVTHVLRGMEWQVSTPKHLMLYRGFGWSPPIYGHLPLVLNADGSKLSKRQNDIRIQYFKNSGILPLALINFVTRAGGGFNISQCERDASSATMEQLISQFEISKINAHSCKLQMERLSDTNNLEISRLLTTASGTQYLVDRVKHILQQRLGQSADTQVLADNSHIISVLNWSKHRLKTLEDLMSKDLMFLWVLPHTNRNTVGPVNPHLISLLKQFVQDLQGLDVDKESLKTYFKRVTSDRGVKVSALLVLLRSAISATKEGPSISEMIEVLGKENTMSRIMKFISSIEQNTNTETRQES